MVYTINNEQLTRRKLVTINGSMVTTETGIPLMLNINLPDVKAACADVRLAKLDGTPIAREIECKDVPNTDDVTIHYPFDTVLNEDSQFWVYWGNPNLTEPAADSTYGSQAVWDGYRALYLMNGDPSTTILDSTSNNNDQTTAGAMTSGDLVDGEFGKAVEFDGANDYSTAPDTASLAPAAEGFTVTSRFYMPAAPNNSGLLLSKQSMSSSTLREFDVYIKSDKTLQLNVYDESADSYLAQYITTPLSTGWHTVSCRYDGGTTTSAITWYVDSSLVSVTPLSGGTFTAVEDLAGTLNIGFTFGHGYLNIQIACLDYSNIRSANYIATNHNNLNNPTASGTTPFYKTIGEPQHQRRVPQFIN